MDKFLFLGHSPTLSLLNIKSPVFMRLMYFSYASFYAAFPVSFAAAFLSRNTGEMRRLVLGIMLIYFFGLALFYLFPSVGPVFYTPELFADIPNKWQKVLWGGHLAIQANRETFAAAPFLGVAAMPSLHGAHALFLVMIARRYHRKLFLAYLPWITLLYISTVYMGWHYVVDLVAGALISIVVKKGLLFPKSGKAACPLFRKISAGQRFLISLDLHRRR
jgi:membrane-associated phospholipid phosphatase